MQNVTIAPTDELVSGCNLLIYKKVWNEKRGKFDKKPYNPKKASVGESVYALPNDLSSCGDYSDCVFGLHAGDYDGIGFLLSKDDPYMCIDLDNCLTDGKLSAFAKSILDQLPSTRVEISPSGTGVHIWLRGKLPGSGINTEAIEIYDDLRFMTLTGNILPGCPQTIAQAHQSTIDKLYWTYKKQRKETQDGNVFQFPLYKSAQVSDLIDRFLAKSNKCIEAWDHRGHPGRSQSEWDQAIANMAWAREFTEEECANLIIANREHHGADVSKAHRQDYITQTIQLAKDCTPQRNDADPSVYDVTTAEQILLDPKPIKWLISRIFMAEGINWMFGPPSTFKSFLAINIGLSVALGRSWCGNHVEQRKVLYIAAEGQQGIGQRLEAAYKQFDISAEEASQYFNFILSAVPINDIAAFQKLKRTLKSSDLDGSLIILDTKQMNMLGSDSDAKDVNLFINSMRELQAQHKTTFLIVDHTSYADPEKMRGVSQQTGAAESSYKLEASEDRRLIKFEVHKSPKDGKPAEPIVFEVIETPVSEAWRSIPDEDPTSIILEQTDEPFNEDEQEKGTNWTNPERILFTLNQLYNHQLMNAGDNERVTVRVLKADLREECLKRFEMRPNTFSAALQRMIRNQDIEEHGQWVAPIKNR